MDGPTRRLAAVACKQCGETLVVHEIERRVRCACDHGQLVPLETVEDLDFLRKLPFDASAEVDEAVGHEVESAYEAPEPPRVVLLGLGVLSAGLGAWALPVALEQSTVAMGVIGFVGGFFAMVMPLGWTVQWMTTMSLAKAERRARRAVRRAGLDEACPECATKVQRAPMPGTFACPGCETELLATEFFIVRSGAKVERERSFRARAAQVLAKEPWLAGGRLSLGDRALLLFVAGGLVFVAWAILFFDPRG